MANRVLLGEHDTYGYGLFVSKPGVDVTGANKNYFTFDSTSASMGQLLVFEHHTLGAWSGWGPSITVEKDFNNFGKNVFGVMYDSQVQYTIPRYGITFNSSLTGLSLSITKTNSTTSRYTLTNANTGPAKAVVIIFAENV